MKRKEFYEYACNRTPGELKAIGVWGILNVLISVFVVGPFLLRGSGARSVLSALIFLWASAYSLRFVIRWICGEVDPRFSKCPFCGKNIWGQFYSQTITTGKCPDCSAQLYEDDVEEEKIGNRLSPDELSRAVLTLYKWSLFCVLPGFALWVILVLFVVGIRMEMGSITGCLVMLISTFSALGLGCMLERKKMRALGLCCPYCDKRFDPVRLTLTTRRCTHCGKKVLSDG